MSARVLCDCCEAAPSAIEYEELNFCADCLVILPYALADLGHAIARFVRRATVAELVKEARRGTRHARPCIDAADETCGCCVGSSRTAIDALARLAEEVSGG